MYVSNVKNIWRQENSVKQRRRSLNNLKKINSKKRKPNQLQDFCQPSVHNQNSKWTWPRTTPIANDRKILGAIVRFSQFRKFCAKNYVKSTMALKSWWAKDLREFSGLGGLEGLASKKIIKFNSSGGLEGARWAKMALIQLKLRQRKIDI